MNSIKFLLLALIVLGFASCKAPQGLSSSNAKKRSVKFLLKKLDKNKVNFEWFGCKSKIKFASEKQNLSATAKIRMQKDSLIWIVIRKINVEGARIRITPETIEILDRQNTDYIRKPFSAIKDEYGLDISFSDLQNLVLGNAIMYQNREFNAVIRENKHLLRTPNSEKDVLKIFLMPTTFLLSEIRGSSNNNSLSIEYSDYEEIEQQKIATRKSINIDSENNGQVEIELIYSKIELNIPQKVKFVVPDSYK